jgi:hypothetical protein
VIARGWRRQNGESGVGPFRESVGGHVGGKGEGGVVVGSTQTEEGSLHVPFDGVG